jgi:hypothetical protein
MKTCQLDFYGDIGLHYWQVFSINSFDIIQKNAILKDCGTILFVTKDTALWFFL